MKLFIKARALAFILLVAPSHAWAHDFWIQPQTFVATENAALPITLLVGTGADRQRSTIARERIVRFDAYGPARAHDDLRPRLVSETSGALGLSTAFEAPGAHMLVLETNNAAQSRLPAARFNAYLADEGLTLVQAERERTGRTGVEGSEIYRRCAKTVLRVGDAPLDSRVITRRYGLALELVPEAAPAVGEMSVRAYFRGRLLPGALVKLRDLSNDAQPLQMETSDAHGRARFILPSAGAWMLNVVWSTPRPRGADTDFETYFSSFAFAT